MSNLTKSALRTATMALLAAGVSWAAVLPDENNTTTMTATVAEQAQLTTPGAVSFTVADVTSVTVADSAVSVSATSIALSTDTQALKISLAPNAVQFTPPTGATVTWDSSDVSWTSTGTNWTPNNAALSGTAGVYVEVATCTANATSCSSSDLTFSLAAKPTIDGSGAFSLVVTWKFESI